MKYLFIKISLIVAGVMFIQSCAELEGELAPLNSIPASEAINSAATANAAVNGIYNQMQANDFDKWLSLAQYFSDEAEATGTFPTRLEFGNLNVFPANGTAAGVFTSLYTTINNANNVITLVPGVEDESFSDAQRADAVGQAKFLRAHCYLHLVTLWGDVPLITTPTSEVGEALNVPKNSAAEIYSLIVSDLNDAAANVLADVGPGTASKQAANAMLARVALYQGNYGEAQSKAIQVLGSDFDLTTVPYLQDQIYSLIYTTADGNVLNFFYGPSDFNGRYSIGPSQALLNAFESGDIRRDLTIDDQSASVPFGVKYPSFAAGISGSASDPIFFIRHAEMVLIIAEAAAEAGDFDTANRWFNQVRLRAGLDPAILDSSNYVDLILQERFVEFAFEGPQRLIDLRRRGRALDVLGSIGYDACDNVWPLPQRDLDRNPNLQQNSCCNC